MQAILLRILIPATGSLIGAYLCARIQFGFVSLGNLSSEIFLVGISMVIAFLYTAVLFPVCQRIDRSSIYGVATLVPALALLSSLGIGLWLYTGWLHRPLSHVMTRDWPFVIAFGLMGAGYAIGHHVQRRMQGLGQKCLPNEIALADKPSDQE